MCKLLEAAVVLLCLVPGKANRYYKFISAVASPAKVIGRFESPPGLA